MSTFDYGGLGEHFLPLVEHLSEIDRCTYTSTNLTGIVSEALDQDIPTFRNGDPDGYIEVRTYTGLTVLSRVEMVGTKSMWKVSYNN